MNNPGQTLQISDPAARITVFLNQFIALSGLDLRFHEVPFPASTDSASSQPTPLDEPPSETEVFEPILALEFEGLDTPILTARNGELLHALEHMAARILRLDASQHELISFDAEDFKRNRLQELEAAARTAVLAVQATGRPYAFPPMSSRERRLLHLAVSSSGLPTVSKGENPRRYVVLYPEGYDADSMQPQDQASGISAEDRTDAIRRSFRRR